jgi:phosphatidate phosphatase APP1
MRFLFIMNPSSGRTSNDEAVTAINNVLTESGSVHQISDLDDTLIDSFVSNKVKQLWTLLFTSVEKRKAVVAMASLIKQFTQSGQYHFTCLTANKTCIRCYTGFWH